ncbi:MAG: hypothetical protein JW974_00020 [Alphaproteobacteria bacterium]|nr:hypothetical protein [Alphaproteobacteria bacterium]MBN2675099.1 hypothetical protein [Alphaproteobacteria bacterium]
MTILDTSVLTEVSSKVVAGILLFLTVVPGVVSMFYRKEEFGNKVNDKVNKSNVR